jgi:hypothetical protein
MLATINYFQNFIFEIFVVFPMLSNVFLIFTQNKISLVCEKRLYLMMAILFFDKFLISSGPVEFLTISITDRKISVL